MYNSLLASRLRRSTLGTLPPVRDTDTRPRAGSELCNNSSRGVWRHGGSSKKTRYAAGPLTFVVRHELWDGNIQDHADQGVAIAVTADVGGKDTTLLRFNCFDFEKSYIYGPENPDLKLEGPAMLGGAAAHTGFPHGPDHRRQPDQLDDQDTGTKLPKMLEKSGYPQIAANTNMEEVQKILPEVEACARELYAVKRNTVKHNRGTDCSKSAISGSGLKCAACRWATAVSPCMCWPISAARRQALHRRNRAAGLRQFLERRALPLRPGNRTIASTGIRR